MADPSRPPLNWESSATTTHPQLCASLPSEVEACLKNARFVGIAPTFSRGFADRLYSVASSGNLRRFFPTHLPHELHLSAVHTLQP